MPTKTKHELHAVTSLDGRHTSRRVYGTTCAKRFEQMLAAVKRAARNKSELRAPTKGNSRAVRVIGVDAISEETDLHAQRIDPGDTFPSVRIASIALGLRPLTLAQLMSQQRKAEGREPACYTVRGVTFRYEGRDN